MVRLVIRRITVATRVFTGFRVNLPLTIYRFEIVNLFFYGYPRYPLLIDLLTMSSNRLDRSPTG